MDSNLEVIVGLGNPGAEHLMDRHNVGFWFVDLLAQRFEGRFRSERKFHGQICRVQVNRHSLWLLRPDTYMNESGRSIRAFLDYQKIDSSRCLVVHDELDLPSGIIRFKKGGGHGGHNGLRSTISHVGKDFMRLRIGVGHPGNQERVIGHVLSRPNKDEEEKILEAVNDGADVVPLLISRGLQRATHKLHNREKKPEPKQKNTNGDAEKKDKSDELSKRD